MHVRRVVTGHDTTGKAVFASDDAVEPVTVQLMPGAEFHRLWSGDAAPHLPDTGTPPAAGRYFPPVGGFRFLCFSVPPRGSRDAPAVDVDAGLEEIRQKLPGLADPIERDAPGMHTTATIDFVVVLDGEIVLEVDDGATVTLRPGDTVVQNGTRHRWRNESTAPTRLAAVLIGAHHDRVTPPA